MPWLPYERFRIASPLKPAELADRLSEHVEPRRWIPLGRKPFHGEVTGEGFDLSRTFRCSSGSIPRLRGRVLAVADGSQVEITARPEYGMMIFMTIWFGALFWIGVVGTYVTYIEPIGDPGPGYTPFAPTWIAMMAISWAMLIGPFVLGTRRSRTLLEQILTPPVDPAERWQPKPPSGAPTLQRSTAPVDRQVGGDPFLSPRR